MNDLPKRIWTVEELTEEALREAKRADEATSEWKLWREEALKQQQEAATLRAQLAARDGELAEWMNEAERLRKYNARLTETLNSLGGANNK